DVPRDLHSFPTRRSSDLVAVLTADEGVHAAAMDKVLTRQDWRGKGWSGSVPVQGLHHPQAPVAAVARVGAVRRIRCDAGRAVPRSEEHTSELQSLAYLVC